MKHLTVECNLFHTVKYHQKLASDSGVQDCQHLRKTKTSKDVPMQKATNRPPHTITYTVTSSILTRHLLDLQQGRPLSRNYREIIYEHLF